MREYEARQTESQAVAELEATNRRRNARGAIYVDGRWLRGKKQILSATGIQDWRTVKRLIARGAPIVRVDGMWLTIKPLLDAWMGEILAEKNMNAKKTPRECPENAH